MGPSREDLSAGLPGGIRSSAYPFIRSVHPLSALKALSGFPKNGFHIFSFRTGSTTPFHDCCRVLSV